MIATKQIHEAEGVELSRLLGEVLLSKCCLNCVHCLQKPIGCFSCLSNVSVNAPRGWITRPDEHLCLDFKPDLIPLDDWSAAMKWRDWAVGEFGEVAFYEALVEMLAEDTGYRSSRYGVVCKTEPHHYLRTAAECAIKGGE